MVAFGDIVLVRNGVAVVVWNHVMLLCHQLRRGWRPFSAREERLALFLHPLSAPSNMSERKVLNKYFPPDFDPALIPRRKGPKNSQQVVRLMAPFSMRCNTCGEYIYKGKKFNARKETVEGEDYYGIKIFRFYIKCTPCSAEITFKTDPKNTDYSAEHGASRNFEPWREEKAVEEEDRLAKLEEEENNPMKVSRIARSTRSVRWTSLMRCTTSALETQETNAWGKPTISSCASAAKTS